MENLDTSTLDILSIDLEALDPLDADISVRWYYSYIIVILWENVGIKNSTKLNKTSQKKGKNKIYK